MNMRLVRDENTLSYRITYRRYIYENIKSYIIDVSVTRIIGCRIVDRMRFTGNILIGMLSKGREAH